MQHTKRSVTSTPMAVMKTRKKGTGRGRVVGMVASGVMLEGVTLAELL